MDTLTYSDISEPVSNLKSKTTSLTVTKAIALSTFLAFTCSNDCSSDLFFPIQTNESYFTTNSNLEAKLTIKERYSLIQNSEWFVGAYKDMSLGELLSLDL